MKKPRIEEPEKEKQPGVPVQKVPEAPKPRVTEELFLQSPIDLVQDDTIPQECDLFFEYERKVKLIVQQGEHTVNFVPQTKDNAILVKDMRYCLVQFHFHTPSEHSIDGRLFPAELHLVHQNEAGDYAVVGIMLDGFSFGDMTAGVYRTVAQTLVKRRGASGDVAVELDLTHMLCKELEFFWYEGSLTTPPYTQGVAWFVGKRFLPQDILCELELAMAEKNNREIQLLQGRPVFFGRAKGRKL